MYTVVDGLQAVLDRIDEVGFNGCCYEYRSLTRPTCYVGTVHYAVRIEYRQKVLDLLAETAKEFRPSISARLRFMTGVDYRGPYVQSVYRVPLYPRLEAVGWTQKQDALAAKVLVRTTMEREIARRQEHEVVREAVAV